MTEYKNLLQSLFDERVRFLVVGGYAVIAHGVSRATNDIDIWIEPTRENAARTLSALTKFGANVGGLTVKQLADPERFFRIGEESERLIDIMGNPGGGVEFYQAWDNRFETDFCDCVVPFVGLQDLIRIKRAVGRNRDLADIDSLRAFHRLPDDD